MSALWCFTSLRTRSRACSSEVNGRARVPEPLARAEAGATYRVVGGAATAGVTSQVAGRRRPARTAKARQVLRWARVRGMAVPIGGWRERLYAMNRIYRGVQCHDLAPSGR